MVERYHRPDRESYEPEEEEHELRFVLPLWDPVLSFSCAREWTEDKRSFQCGCPRCLERQGLTLVYHVEDWRESGDGKETWRKRVASIRTARLAPHLVVPGYPPKR